MSKKKSIIICIIVLIFALLAANTVRSRLQSRFGTATANRL